MGFAKSSTHPTGCCSFGPGLLADLRLRRRAIALLDFFHHGGEMLRRNTGVMACRNLPAWEKTG
jgi:hypothetical protein